MGTTQTPLYYPPGKDRSDPLVRLYDLFYELQAQVTAQQNQITALQKAGNNSV
jgi:hypothetical protein